MDKLPSHLREFSDTSATRHEVIKRVTEAFTKNPIIDGRHYQIRLSDVKIPYQRYSLAEQKQHLLEDRDLVLPVKGKVELIDKKTGKVVERTTKTLAHLPYLTPRGTMISGGNEFAVINQYRLKAGVYNRVRENGELESQFNVIPGTGQGFRLAMEPQTGVFEIQLGNSKRTLYPWLKAVGVDDGTLEKTWGKDILEANKVAKDPRALNNIYERVLGARAPKDMSDADKAREIYERFSSSKLDPDVTKVTLGKPYENINKNAIIDATRRILNINRGIEEPDDRDSLRFRTFHGVEDFLSEKIEKDAGRLRRALAHRMDKKRTLDAMPAGFFTPQLKSLLQGDARALPLEEINPVDLLDQQQRAIALGEGGIPSIQSVPGESRNVHSSQFGYIDSIRGPESAKIGVDVRIASNAVKSNDKKIYSKVQNISTGKVEYIDPDTMITNVVAFPGEMQKPSNQVKVMKNGKIDVVNKKEVKYELPSASNMFALSSNLVPMVNSVSGNRLLMAGKAFAQTLPLVNPEAPLVQSKIPGEELSFEQKVGQTVAAHKARVKGKVQKITNDEIIIQDDKGQIHRQDIYNNFPFNRQTFIHTKHKVVKPGDEVQPDQILAATNFTDEKGTLAIGTNLRSAYLPYKGYGSDDGIVISQSASKKLTSEHLYSKDLRLDKNTVQGLDKFVSYFPTMFTREQASTLDSDGVVKPGTKLKPGDPVVVALRKKTLSSTDLMLGKIHKHLKDAYEDASVIWDQDYDGEVIDVVKTSGSVKVNIKTAAPAKVADKLCFDDQTEVLTLEGWKFWKDVSLSDEFATLDIEKDELIYQKPISINSHKYEGEMYRLETQQISLCVTPNHDLLVSGGDPRRADGKSWKKIHAKEVFGRFLRHKKNALTWKGITPEEVIIGSFKFRPRDWAEFLGFWLSDGNIVWEPSSGNYGIEITKKKAKPREYLELLLKRLNLHYCYTGDKIRIYSKELAEYFKKFGKCYEKYIPRDVLGWDTKELCALYEAFLMCDGHRSKKGTCHLDTTSYQMAGDFQELCLKIGFSANIIKRDRSGEEHCIKATRPCYQSRVVRTKNTPSVNYGHTAKQNGQIETYIPYNGIIYCATVPNGTFYTRRNGKTIWSGNSGRYGNKGVISLVLPDDQMPIDESGNPVEIILNPLGVISRINPAQAYEAVLGKVARKTGKPVLMQSFDGDNLKKTKKILADHGIKPLENLTDPLTGKVIPDVLTGESFVLKISKTAKSGFGAREIGPYTSEEIPAKGGKAGAKRIGNLELNALLSHGAIENIRDAYLVKGQKNTAFWRAMRLGQPLPSPTVPFIYTKFQNSLKAAGVNVKKEPHGDRLLPLLDRDVNELTKGEIKSALMFRRRDLEPETGGLFDPAVTGGARGERWGHVALAEPLPNPVMEEPIRRMLNLTKDQMRKVIAHSEKIGNKSGSIAIKEALEKIDIDQKLKETNEMIESGRRTGRDNAIKLKGYLETLRKHKIKPSELMISKLPVIPPVFRPVTFRGEESPVKSAVNQLYADVIHVNQQLKELKKDLPEEALGAEKAGLYDSVKAVVGLGDPVSPQAKQKELRGFLKDIVGTSPKSGMFQFKMLGKSQDLSGRAVIVPDPTLGMDEVGLPEEMAWSIYKPFMMRDLVQRGIPAVQAAKELDDRTPRAREALFRVIKDRPVMVNRAPTLHKFNILALKPVLRPDKSMALPPLIEAGFNADHDGDAMQVHVPVTEGARLEALDKMLPSKNLFALGQMSPMHKPVQEAHYGLYQATEPSKKEVKKFASKEAAMEAYRKGEIAINDPIEIPDA